MTAPDLPRCNRCGWPLVLDAKGGCTPASCSQRPLSSIRNQHASSVSASIVLTLDESTELIALAARQAHERADEAERALAAPIPIVLTCPLCRLQHIDQGEWTTRLHRTHRCVDGPFGKGCGHEWRPSNHSTVGVTYEDLAKAGGR